jgi:predicted DCC family thiol-disulfide oxidoreductase YuxK
MALVLYDGECGLCQRSVHAILRRDPSGAFRFASQSSPVGARLLAEHGLAGEQGRTLVLVDDDGAAYVRSDALLRIAARLRGAARLLSALRLVPRPLRDAAYAAIARNRHRLRSRSCPAVPAELRHRFIEE